MTEVEQNPLFPEMPPGIEYQEILTEALPKNTALVGPAPDAALIRSVDRWGIMQPVVVRPAAPDYESDSLFYEVVDGRRRIKASRVLNRETVRAFVIEAEDWSSAHKALTMALGGTRSDNHAADLDTILSLMQEGASESEIAQATGHAIETIRRRLRLTNLEPRLLEAFRSGRMATGVAERAARLPRPAQFRLIEAAGGRKITGPMVEEQRRARAASAASSTPLDFMSDMATAEDVPPGELGSSFGPDEYTAGINNDPATFVRDTPDGPEQVTARDLTPDPPDAPDDQDGEESDPELEKQLQADREYLENRTIAMRVLKSRERSKWTNRDIEAVENLLDSVDWT